MWTHRQHRGGCDFFTAWWNMCAAWMDPATWCCCGPSRESRLEYLKRMKEGLQRGIEELDREIADLQSKQTGTQQ
jgi:hypothetical protein